MSSCVSLLRLVAFFEGFGVPLLEAMQAEIPILTSNQSSLPEIAGAAALYCDPNSPEDIARQLSALYHDAELRDELVKEGQTQRKKFSWEKTAEAIWDKLKGLAEN